MKIKTILLLLALCVTMGVSAQQTDKTFTVKGVSFVMKSVAGGTFQMGNVGINERPIHSVTLSSYYIGQTEVTQALWEAVMGSNPSNFKGNNLPVEQVLGMTARRLSQGSTNRRDRSSACPQKQNGNMLLTAVNTAGGINTAGAIQH